MDKQQDPNSARRKALRNAVILALVALAFYVGIFFLVKGRQL